MTPQAGKVTLLHKNQVPAFVATSEATGFDAENLTDGNETTLWKATSTANQTLTYDQGTAKISEFPTSDFDASASDVSGIDKTPDGTLWACDNGTDKIYNFEADGTPISSFLTSVFDASALSVQGIKFLKNGTLLICDNGTNKIYNVKTDGTLIDSILTTDINSSFTDIQDITEAPNGTIWGCCSASNKIYNFKLNETLIDDFDISSILDIVRGVDYASDDTLWINGTLGANHNIYNINLDATQNSVFASSVFDASATGMRSISYDIADNTLWICDINTDKVYNVRILLAFDCLFLHGHNLNSAIATVLWQYSDDGAAWNDINYPFTPSDDKSIGIRLGGMRTTRAVRVILSDLTVIPWASGLIIGQQSEIEFAALYDPDRVKIDRQVNRTLHGQTSDVTEYFRERIVNFRFTTVSDVVYQKVRFLFDNESDQIIGVYWEPNNFPHEVWPMELDDDESNNPFVVSGVSRDVSLNLRGVEE